MCVVLQRMIQNHTQFKLTEDRLCVSRTILAMMLVIFLIWDSSKAGMPPAPPGRDVIAMLIESIHSLRSCSMALQRGNKERISGLMCWCCCCYASAHCSDLFFLSSLSPCRPFPLHLFHITVINCSLHRTLTRELHFPSQKAPGRQRYATSVQRKDTVRDYQQRYNDLHTLHCALVCTGS